MEKRRELIISLGKCRGLTLNPTPYSSFPHGKHANPRPNEHPGCGIGGSSRSPNFRQMPKIPNRADPHPRVSCLFWVLGLGLFVSVSWSCLCWWFRPEALMSRFSQCTPFFYRTQGSPSRSANLKRQGLCNIFLRRGSSFYSNGGIILPLVSESTR